MRAVWGAVTSLNWYLIHTKIQHFFTHYNLFPAVLWQAMIQLVELQQGVILLLLLALIDAGQTPWAGHKNYSEYMSKNICIDDWMWRYLGNHFLLRWEWLSRRMCLTHIKIVRRQRGCDRVLYYACPPPFYAVWHRVSLGMLCKILHLQTSTYKVICNHE